MISSMGIKGLSTEKYYMVNFFRRLGLAIRPNLFDVGLLLKDNLDAINYENTLLYSSLKKMDFPLGDVLEVGSGKGRVTHFLKNLKNKGLINRLCSIDNHRNNLKFLTRINPDSELGFITLLNIKKFLNFNTYIFIYTNDIILPITNNLQIWRFLTDKYNKKIFIKFPLLDENPFINNKYIIDTHKLARSLNEHLLKKYFNIEKYYDGYLIYSK